MVMNNLFKYISFAALAIVFSGCNDAEYSKGGKEGNSLGVRAFLVESMSSAGIANRTVSLTGNTTANLTLTPSLTDKSKEDATYKLILDEELLKKFNEEEGTGYSLYPKELVNLGKEITIGKGKYSADPFFIGISPLPIEKRGIPFALPLRLEKLSGKPEVTTKTSSFIYVISSTIVDDLAMFTSATGLKTRFENKLSLKQFTIEMRLQVQNTYNRNRDIFYTNNSSGSLMFRFEDPQKDDKGVKAHSLVQFQGVGGYLNPSLPIETNKWQHYAVTYDGTAITIYINGAFAGSKEFAPNVVLNGEFDYMSFMGVGGNNGQWEPGDRWWGRCKTLTNEIRVWSVCRTEEQIKNSIKSVDPESKGLEGYWRISKSTYNEEDHSFKDLSGHKRNLHTDKSFTWINNVSSEDTETKW